MNATSVGQPAKPNPAEPAPKTVNDRSAATNGERSLFAEFLAACGVPDPASRLDSDTSGRIAAPETCATLIASAADQTEKVDSGETKAGRGDTIKKTDDLEREREQQADCERFDLVACQLSSHMVRGRASSAAEAQAAGPAHAAAVPPPMVPSQLQQMVGRMLRRCQVVSGPTGQAIELQLESRRYSNLEVRLTLQGGRLQAALATEDALGYQTMVGDVEQLEKRLQSRGFETEIEVSMRPGHDRQQQGQRREQRGTRTAAVDEKPAASARASKRAAEPPTRALGSKGYVA